MICISASACDGEGFCDLLFFTSFSFGTVELYNHLHHVRCRPPTTYHYPLHQRHYRCRYSIAYSAMVDIMLIFSCNLKVFLCILMVGIIFIFSCNLKVFLWLVSSLYFRVAYSYILYFRVA